MADVTICVAVPASERRTGGRLWLSATEDTAWEMVRRMAPHVPSGATWWTERKGDPFGHKTTKQKETK